MLNIKLYNLMTNLYLHNNITAKIFKALKDNSLHNSIIFTGPRGIGKYTVARQLINFILSHKISDFAQASDNFFSLDNINKNQINLINNNTNSNFLEITKSAEKLSNIISIDEIRSINVFLQSSTEDYYKIILINYIDILNINSANALLKNLEDTPKNTIFILINHNYNNVLSTIKSRSLAFQFNALSNSELLKLLKINNVVIEDKNKEALLSLASGSFTTLMWYLQESNLNLYKAIVKSLNNKNLNDIIKLKPDILSLKDENFFILFNVLENYIYQRINIIGVSKAEDIIFYMYQLKINLSLLNLDKFITFFNVCSKIIQN